MRTVEPRNEKQDRLPEAAWNYTRRTRGIGGDAPHRPAAEVDTPGVSLKILLAEDDQLNRLLAVRILEKLGHEVTVARNGREAVELATTSAFDLVFMDMLMPELNGPEAARAIRLGEDATHRHVPIIALTASGDPRDREICLAAGMDEYASKPLSVQELRTVIGRFTESRTA